ncbi:plasmid partitioning protein RepB [Amaricoccus sp. W119]|uniref:plasmid partitioning protein RepB n=1 Tax=Amaricoccus sp. W119 TaxID=3391833 RepID=UPI0039A5FB3C
MTDGKKRRLSMLDQLTAVGSTPSQSSMMSTNRALRAARDAVDSHQIWDLDPETIDDNRLSDRLSFEDIDDLRTSIEANGQTVPILVRRHPTESDRYLLVYGRRRLEAVRRSDKVKVVRALIASLDDDAAVRAQATENTGRRDLSYIERALFAAELMDAGFGTQAQVAAVLNTSQSAISMAVSIARTIGPQLSKAIGPAPDRGRPRWEGLVARISEVDFDRAELTNIALSAREGASPSAANGKPNLDPSDIAFDAVFDRVQTPRVVGQSAGVAAPSKIVIGKRVVARVTRSSKNLRIDVSVDVDGFATWLQNQSEDLIREAHTRWAKQVKK